MRASPVTVRFDVISSISIHNIPEFRAVFTEEQLVLAAYEALLCCTVVTSQTPKLAPAVSTVQFRHTVGTLGRLRPNANNDHLNGSIFAQQKTAEETEADGLARQHSTPSSESGSKESFSKESVFNPWGTAKQPDSAPSSDSGSKPDSVSNSPARSRESVASAQSVDVASICGQSVDVGMEARRSIMSIDKIDANGTDFRSAVGRNAGSGSVDGMEDLAARSLDSSDLCSSSSFTSVGDTMDSYSSGRKPDHTSAKSSPLSKTNLRAVQTTVRIQCGLSIAQVTSTACSSCTLCVESLPPSPPPRLAMSSQAHHAWRTQHEDLVLALSVWSDDVGKESPSKEFERFPVSFEPAWHIHWRWRCVQYRRTTDFQNFTEYRSWAIRQVGMIACACLHHIQSNIKQKWTIAAEAVKAVESTFHSVGLKKVGSEKWAKKLAVSELQSDDMAYKLVLVSRHLAHQLDYEIGFDDARFREALENLNAIVSAVFSTSFGSRQRNDCNASFVPLNCELYQRLLLKSVFTPLKIHHEDDVNDDSDDGVPTAGGAMDELLSDKNQVVGALKHTWHPLRLSGCFHEVLMATSAFENFKQEPSEKILGVLHVRTHPRVSLRPFVFFCPRSDRPHQLINSAGL